MKRSKRWWFIAFGILIGMGAVAGMIWSYEASYCGEGNLRPVPEAHKIPPYPDVSATAGEEGTTLLQVVIGKDGVPATLTTPNSSGFPRLDAAAAQYIKENWRWKSLAWGCHSVTTNVKIVWQLKKKDVLWWIPNHRQK